MKKKYFLSFQDTKYLLSMEVCKQSHASTNGEHMHFVLHIEPKPFLAWYATLKNRYNLAGKNSKKTTRYIGFLNLDKVKDPTQLLKYTLKDGNFINKGFDEEEIQALYEQSYQKASSIIEELMEHLDTCSFKIGVNELDITMIEIEVLKFHMKKNIKCCKSKIRAYTTEYLQVYYKDRFNNEVFRQIYFYTMN